MLDRPLTAEEQAAERVALELALRGVREGLTVMPARSPWVGFFRDLRNGWGARLDELSAPVGYGSLDVARPVDRPVVRRDDLAA
jgi:hypothetical protein